MLIPDYPNNSRLNKPAEKAPEVEPRFEPIVINSVTKKKPSIGRRMRRALFNETDNLVTSLVMDVVVPALKDAIVDVVTQGIYTAVGRSAPPRATRGPSTFGRTHISYNQASAVSNTSITQPRPPIKQPSSQYIDDVILGSHVEAETIHEKMREILEDYGVVKVSNLNDLLDQSSTSTDHKYGWTNLYDMKIRRVSSGYLLMLPPVEDIR